MAQKHAPIKFTIIGGSQNFIYYHDSALLNQLRYYPYIQLAIIFLFIMMSYLAFNAARKSEQNQVWVGLARETAHQLGTPISSLMAWVEYLKLKNEDDEISHEIEKDVKRLETVADRFSKIGSTPKLERNNVVDALQRSINYMKARTSNKVEFSFTYPVHGVMVEINSSLFQWVIENLFANAIDAMKGTGSINVNVFINENEWVIIDVTDSGHGIKRKNLKTVFEPGFTTKKTGWGLGLSLVKRIMESYHSGKIYVHNTEVGVGTTFRIELKRV
jgi:signal transduction histidine kinase